MPPATTASSETAVTTLYPMAALAFTLDGAPSDAALALDALFTAASPLDLLRLAAAAREPWRWPNSPWPELRAARVAALDPSLPASAACVCLASLDRDGYVREAATRLLARCACAYARRFLWMRLDDVVPSISAFADGPLLSALPDLDADDLVADLPLLDQLATRDRARRSAPLFAALSTAASASPEVRAALRRALSSTDPALRSACARRLAGDPDDVARAEALLAALRDPSPRVHLWAAREATSRKTAPAVAAAVAPAMCAHPNPSVRLRGLRHAARGPDGDAHLRRAVIDVDATVRFEARSALVRLGGADHRALAAEVLREGAPSAWPDPERALGALGAMDDVGERDDWPLVARFLEHPRVRVRAEALRALGSLAPELFVDVFVAGVRHRNRRVAREATRSLERCAASMSVEAFRARVPDDALVAMLRDAGLRPACREAVRRLLSARGLGRRRRG